MRVRSGAVVIALTAVLTVHVFASGGLRVDWGYRWNSMLTSHARAVAID